MEGLNPQLGLLAGARASAKALGLGFCKSQLLGYDCPLPLAWCALPTMVPGLWAPPA